MASAKTVIALLLSLQGAQAMRTEAETASALEEASALQRVLENLKGTPCEYATSHKVKTLGINMGSGVSALKEVQGKINELAVACHRIQKAEEAIGKAESHITELEQNLLENQEAISKVNQDITEFKSKHTDITDEACKAAGAQTGFAGKSKRALSSVTGGVSNWFKDLRASKDEKAARKKDREAVKAAAAEKLQAAQTVTDKCNELGELESTLGKSQKSMDKHAKDKVKTEDRLAKQKAELVEAQAAKDTAKKDSVDIMQKISDDITSNLGSGSSDATPSDATPSDSA
eukprot:TRINITY_DN374_c0_g1_i1.p1 TRINITY_DN374_c0_g1~~TRINITY_DN374_c0_g1_i1.p1  ORF type:complete len:289 (-),score=100.06 TRINITY_DN374_c0_g1_i1:179-1045(-)